MPRELTQAEIEAMRARSSDLYVATEALAADCAEAIATPRATFEAGIAALRADYDAATASALQAWRTSSKLHADGSREASDLAREIYDASLAPARAVYLSAAAVLLADYEAAIARDVETRDVEIQKLIAAEEAVRADVVSKPADAVVAEERAAESVTGLR